MLTRLLERLIPAIYADPDRDRRCRGCDRKSPPSSMVKFETGYVCDEECADEARQREAI